MTTPDLEPTQPISTIPADASVDKDVLEEEPRHGERSALRFLFRALFFSGIAVGALVATALLLTPPRESVLILGTDARPDELKRGEAGRTDTLLLFVADRATPRVAMLSVPRDLWVAIPGHGEERINAAYALGGSHTAKQTVSNVIGQRIDRFLVIGLQGAREVVDAVGGIDITVPMAIHDETYPTDDYGYQTVDIPAGRQHMDGDTALKYARTRHQDSDFARTARQQQVLSSIRTAMLSPLNWPRLPAVLFATSQSIKTDVNPLDAIAIGAAVLRDPGEPDRMVIDTTLATELTGRDGAYLLEPKRELKPAVARFLGGSSAASVEVLNAAGANGLAARTADRLTERGFVIAGIGDAPKAQSQTTIVAKPGALGAAEQIARALGVPTARVSQSASFGTADIQVVLGSDAR